jgi:hypothetical protein
MWCEIRSAVASIKCEREIAIVCADVHTPNCGTGDEAIEKFAADFRQEGVGDQRIDHARAAFKFGAAFTD